MHGKATFLQRPLAQERESLVSVILLSRLAWIISGVQNPLHKNPSARLSRSLYGNRKDQDPKCKIQTIVLSFQRLVDVLSLYQSKSFMTCETSHTDALLCALTTTEPLIALARLIAGPLQFSYGDRQPGMMPWSGQGESWICWRYPYPRHVATVLLTLPLEVLSLADLELLAFSLQADCFVPVEFEITELEGYRVYPIVGGCDAAVLLSLKVLRQIRMCEEICSGVWFQERHMEDLLNTQAILSF